MKNRHKNPDLRRQVQMPGPEIEVIENSLLEILPRYSTFHIHEAHSAITESVFQRNCCTSHNWKVLYT
jgi:hypothetical protein